MQAFSASRFGLFLALLITVGATTHADTITVPEQSYVSEVLIYAVALSPDGHSLLLGGWKGAVRMDTATGEVLTRYTGHSRGISSVAFSPDGTKVLTGSYDQSAKMWDAETGAELQTFSGHTDLVLAVAFSPDGTQVLTGSWDNTAKLWDASNGMELRTFAGHTEWINSVAISPDGTQVLTGSQDKTAKLWDATTGTETLSFAHSRTHSLTSVAFSPDGTQVLTGSAYGTAKLWDADTGNNLRTFFGHTGAVMSVAFSSDGTKVLTGSTDNTAKLWNAVSGAVLRTFAGHSDYVVSVAFSADGTHVLTGSSDMTAMLWKADVPTGEGEDAGPILCSIGLSGLQMIHANGSQATGYAVFQWNEEETEVILTIRHDVKVPTGAYIREGKPGQPSGQRVLDLGPATSPIVTILSEEAFHQFTDGAHHISIQSERYTNGEIRGNLVCLDEFEGENSFCNYTFPSRSSEGWILEATFRLSGDTLEPPSGSTACGIGAVYFAGFQKSELFIRKYHLRIRHNVPNPTHVTYDGYTFEATSDNEFTTEHILYGACDCQPDYCFFFLEDNLAVIHNADGPQIAGKFGYNDNCDGYDCDPHDCEYGPYDGEYDGEIGLPASHSADRDQDQVITLSELLRVIQHFNTGAYHCAGGTEDGYAPGEGSQTCVPHASDYNPQDWAIGLSELLRLIEFFNSGGYHPCLDGEDGFCPGSGAR